MSLFEKVPEDVRTRVADAATWGVKNAGITKGEQMKGTSKIHSFKPPVGLKEACEWLDGQKATSATLIFSNESSVIFKDGVFVEFEDLED